MNPQSDEAQPGFDGAEFWGQVGQLVYPESARTMVNQGTVGEWMNQRDKNALRPVYGSLVDRVTVHWDTLPLNEWASQKYGIQVIGEDAVAQAYGLNIYIKGAKSAWSDQERLSTLIHELKHCEQFERFNSSLRDFGYYYFREYYLAGESYADNALEREAAKAAERYFPSVWSRWQAL